jgi:predicted anti-sigma-YlaC factor YlaD
MKKDCAEHRDALYVLDAPVEHPEVAAALAHLEECPDCRAERQRIAGFDAELDEALTDVALPPRLEERAARIPVEPPFSRRQELRGSRRLALAAGALALAAAVAVFLAVGVKSEPPAIVQQAVTDHLMHPPGTGDAATEVEPDLDADDASAWRTFKRRGERPRRDQRRPAPLRRVRRGPSRTRIR